MHIAYMKNSVQRDTAKVQQMVQQWLLQNPSRSHTNNLHKYEYNYKDHCILAITVYQRLRHGDFSKDVQRHSHLQRSSYKLAFTDHTPIISSKNLFTQSPRPPTVPSSPLQVPLGFCSELQHQTYCNASELHCLLLSDGHQSHPHMYHIWMESCVPR